MNMNAESAYSCSCGRSFLTGSALTTHKRTCRESKKRLSNAIEGTAGLFQAQKKRRLAVLQSALRTGILCEPSDQVEGAGSPSTSALADDVQGTLADGIDKIRDARLQLDVLNDVAHRCVSHPFNLPPQSPIEDMEDSPASLAARRARRIVQFPRRFRDFVASPLDELSPESMEPFGEQLNPPSPITSPANPSRVRRFVDSSKNIFGLFRRYFGKQPTHDPEELVDLDALTEIPSNPAEDATLDLSDLSKEQPLSNSSFYPFPNESSFKLGGWYIDDGPMKSLKSLEKLVKVVGSKSFIPEDVRETQWAKGMKLMGANSFDNARLRDNNPLEGASDDAGWEQKPVYIQVPFHRRDRNPGPKEFYAGEFYHRSLVSVIREKLANPQDDRHFHYEPYELYWQPLPDTPTPIRVYGELYTSPVFLEAHNQLQDSPGEPGCSLPRVVAALMFNSDATQLTSTGDAKLWPLYLWFGNESKYRRSKPTCNLANHIAYFMTLPDNFKDFAAEHSSSRGASKRLYTHCRRELYHAQWEILLDDEFLEAYVHGIVITCCDGITRRFYPRIFTYSADYPEKVIIASIRDKGQCPCPRCLMPLADVDGLGTVEDMQRRSTLLRVDDASARKRVETARRLILQRNHAVSSKDVESLLKDYSMTPTDNAFSKRLAPLGLGFNLYLALVVDLMHEFELGVWKALFIHILRILEAHSRECGTNVTNLLDTRYRMVPSFGRDTIRRFSSNVSELKNLAARDYENMLQCSIAVLDGLLPEPYNTEIMTLLFSCSYWHALAKLRMHTDYTLPIFEEETTRLGAALRSFASNTCEAFDTKELKRETAARNRRKKQNAKTDPAPNTFDSSPRRKKYNIQTIKHHFLGDHPETIRLFGTADSHSTEPGELEHKTPKKRFVRTSGKAFVKQLTGIERREVRVRRIRAKLYGDGKRAADDEPATRALDLHHHIGISQNESVEIGAFLRNNAGDPAIKDFVPKLKANILPRLLRLLKGNPDLDTSGLPLPEQCDPNRAVLVKGNCVYLHRILRINYTSYDVRRLQDIINANSSHSNIMVLCKSADSVADEPSSESSRFRYGRILGTYHVKAMYTGVGMPNHNSHRIEFLWVRWYDQVGQAETGWSHRRLDRVRFAPLDDADAFDILDPSDVLRGCHIIPRFSLGRKHLDSTGMSELAKDASDWREYYVNRFVDRDMTMRYLFGLGVGHAYSHGSPSVKLPPIPETNDCIDPNVTSLTPEDSGPENSLTYTVPKPANLSLDPGMTGSDDDYEDSEGSSTSSDGSSLMSSDGRDWESLEDTLDEEELEELAAEEMYYDG